MDRDEYLIIPKGKSSSSVIILEDRNCMQKFSLEGIQCGTLKNELSIYKEKR